MLLRTNSFLKSLCIKYDQDLLSDEEFDSDLEYISDEEDLSQSNLLVSSVLTSLDNQQKQRIKEIGDKIKSTTIEQAQKIIKSKPLRSLRNKTSIMKNKASDKIKKIARKMKTSNFIRFNDKIAFVLGVVRLIVSFYLLGKAPCEFPLLHNILAFIMIFIRFLRYRKTA